MIEKQTIFLRSSAGEIERVVVQDLGDVLLVCRPDEWARAKKAGERPISVGFKRSDLVRKTSVDKYASY